MTKAFAFTLSVILIMFMFCILIVMYLKKIDVKDFPTGAFLTAIVAITTSYMGIQVVNNGVLGKCYRKEVAELDRINKEDETGGQND